MKSEKIHFYNSKGLLLRGYLDLPEAGDTGVYAVFSHCFTCSKDLKSIANIDSALAASGITTLRFDYSGIGESEGNFSDTNYSDYLDDLISSAGFLKKNFHAPQLLIGHSLGGCVAIEAVRSIQSVRAVAVIGTPAEPGYLSNKLKKTKEKADREGCAYAEIGGSKFKFSKEFFAELEKHRLKPIISNLKKPLLILHSPADTYTPIENAAEIFRAAKHPKSFISFDNIDHLMVIKKDASYAGKVISAWASRYLRY